MNFTFPTLIDSARQNYLSNNLSYTSDDFVLISPKTISRQALLVLADHQELKKISSPNHWVLHPTNISQLFALEKLSDAQILSRKIREVQEILENLAVQKEKLILVTETKYRAFAIWLAWKLKSTKIIHTPTKTNTVVSRWDTRVNVLADNHELEELTLISASSAGVFAENIILKQDAFSAPNTSAVQQAIGTLSGLLPPVNTSYNRIFPASLNRFFPSRNYSAMATLEAGIDQGFFSLACVDADPQRAADGWGSRSHSLAFNGKLIPLGALRRPALDEFLKPGWRITQEFSAFTIGGYSGFMIADLLEGKQEVEIQVFDENKQPIKFGSLNITQSETSDFEYHYQLTVKDSETLLLSTRTPQKKRSIIRSLGGKNQRLKTLPGEPAATDTQLIELTSFIEKVKDEIVVHSEDLRLCLEGISAEGSFYFLLPIASELYNGRGGKTKLTQEQRNAIKRGIQQLEDLAHRSGIQKIDLDFPVNTYLGSPTDPGAVTGINKDLFTSIYP